MKSNSLILLLLLSITFSSCSKKSNNQDANEVAFSDFSSTNLQDVNDIVSKNIDEAISKNTSLDFESIVLEIEALDNIASCRINESGSTLIITDKNDVSINFLVFNKGDNRFFNEGSETSGKSSVQIKKRPPVKPGGNGAAVILAPFQFEFGEDLDQIEFLFENAGYQTTKYLNKEVTLDKIRGDFLSAFDIIFISTHGSKSAELFTSEEKVPVISITPDTEDNKLKYWQELSEEEKNTLALMGSTFENASFAVSAEWFRVTTSTTFNDSWLFINACESTAISSGIDSFVSTFHNLGVAGINGYSSLIAVPLAEAIAEKATGKFTAGEKFVTVHEQVLSDPGISLVAADLKSKLANVFQREIFNVNLFTADKTITDPFYLILPDDLIGTATLTPDSGPEDTEVVFKVVIEPDFIEVVDRITFDIDNTNQNGLVMEKVNDATWQYTDLTAPNGKFPRIDTFAFTAFNSEGEPLGSGSAGFSFTQSLGGKSEKKSNQTWTK